MTKNKLYRFKYSLRGAFSGVKFSKLENIDESSEIALSGIIMDVIKDPTNQIEKALNRANSNEDSIETKTINLYGLQ